MTLEFPLKSQALIMNKTILEIPDGDGIVIQDIQSQEIQVTRLVCLDCPETGQEGKEEARDRLKKLVEGHHVQLSSLGFDHHGRMLVLGIFLSYQVSWEQNTTLKTTQRLEQQCKGSINLILVREGFCYAYPQYSSSCPCWNEILKAQQKAKRTKVGIHQIRHELPWKYRRRIENASNQSFYQMERLFRKYPQCLGHEKIKSYPFSFN